MDLLKALKAKNARVLVLSDANTYFIDIILKVHFQSICLCVIVRVQIELTDICVVQEHGVHDLVNDIITNPAYIDDQGRLRVKRRILATDPQHNCPNPCGVNICKGKSGIQYEKGRHMTHLQYLGQELDNYIATHGPFRNIMYVGDGKVSKRSFVIGLGFLTRTHTNGMFFQNDYCPALRLKASDQYFVRSGKKLADMLATDVDAASKLLVPITYWENHEVIVQSLL